MEETLHKYLPGELRKIADIAGLEAAVRISSVFGGNVIYVPALEELQRLARDEKIRRQYRKGVKVRLLSGRFQISERSIWRVLNRPVPRLKDELISLIERGAEKGP
jgi:Mor family transcriptional regulator